MSILQNSFYLARNNKFGESSVCLSLKRRLNCLIVLDDSESG